MTVTVITENGTKHYPNLTQASVNKLITTISEVLHDSRSYVDRVKFVVEG